jgi:hypothetical protein
MAISRSSSSSSLSSQASAGASNALPPELQGRERGDIVMFRGRKCQEWVIPKDQQPGLLHRGAKAIPAAVAFVAKPVVRAIAAAANKPISSADYDRNACIDTVRGNCKKVYTPVPQSRSDIVKKLGYDPGSQKSIVAYLKSHPELVLRWEGGHQYLLQPSNSSMIFIPDGDIEKAVSIKFYEAGDENADIKSPKELKRTAKAYMIAYESIKEQGGTMCHAIIINPTTKMIWGYDDRPDDGTDISDATTGRWFKIDDDVWKDIAALWDENKTESKDSLDGDKVDRKPKPASNPLSSLLGPRGKDDDDDSDEALRRDVEAQRASMRQANAAAAAAAAAAQVSGGGGPSGGDEKTPLRATASAR